MATFPQRKRTPSFSSSILDSIYRSLDESDDIKGSIKNNNENLSCSSPSSVSSSSSPTNKKNDKLASLRRAIMDDEHWLYITRTNSSVFSSSEEESYQTKRRSRIAEQSDEKQRTKKTLVRENDRLYDENKFKAVKILEELKRSKKPKSPGARLTSFLNSIFQSHANKAKLCSDRTIADVKSSSRSCFSRARYKTDNKNCNNLKRSDKLYPFRVTHDGDCRDSVHKNITREKKPIPELMSLKEEIKTKLYQSELTCITRKLSLMDYVRSYRDEGKEEEEDALSYSSSDLFELDNNRIGLDRYVKELPVYETTDFETNQAIARGLLL